MPVALALRDQARPAQAPDARSHAVGARARLRAVPPRTWAVLALVVVVLTAAPVLITLARPGTFNTTFVVAQHDPSQASDVPLDERATRTIVGFETQRRIVALRDARDWSLEDVTPDPTVEPGPRPGTVRVTIPADTAEQSEGIARVAADVITTQRRGVVRKRAEELARLREVEIAVQRRDLAPARRARLREEAAFIRASLPGLVAMRISDPPTAVAPASLIDRLDAGGVPRPDPIWAGAVGLLLGLALCSLWLTLSGRSSTRPEQPAEGHTS